MVSLLSHKKRVLLRKYQLIQPTYISNIGLYHAMYSRYMFMKCKWWMTYGQGRLISNIGPGQSSALRPLSIQTLTETRGSQEPVIAHLGSISQEVVSLRLILSMISKLLIGWNSHLRLILDLQLFVKSTTGFQFDI